jgi:hypothetical protein
MGSEPGFHKAATIIITDAMENLRTTFESTNGKGIQWDNTPLLATIEALTGDAAQAGDPARSANDKDDYWFRGEIIYADAPQVSMGAARNLYRISGLLVYGIFGQADTGPNRVLTAADVLCDYYRAKDISDAQQTVRFRDPVPVPVGQTGKWYQMNVRIPFYSHIYK